MTIDEPEPTKNPVAGWIYHHTTLIEVTAALAVFTSFGALVYLTRGDGITQHILPWLLVTALAAACQVGKNEARRWASRRHTDAICSTCIDRLIPPPNPHIQAERKKRVLTAVHWYYDTQHRAHCPRSADRDVVLSTLALPGLLMIAGAPIAIIIVELPYLTGQAVGGLYIVSAILLMHRAHHTHERLSLWCRHCQNRAVLR